MNLRTAPRPSNIDSGDDSGLTISEAFTLGLFLLLITDSWVRAADLLPWCLAFLTILGAFYARERNRRQRRQFRQQLMCCRKDLRDGASVLVDHLVLRQDSTVTSYRALVGVLLFAIEIPSPYRPAQGQLSGEGLVYSAISLITGWWVIPSGPLRTLMLLNRNVSGGDTVSVAALARINENSSPTSRSAARPLPRRGASSTNQQMCP